MTPRHFAWQALHLATCAFVSRGRRGTWRHPRWFCVAGVALMALGWLWRRAWTGLVAGDTAALCVAGVALGDVCVHFTWQAWHFWHTPSLTHNFVTHTHTPFFFVTYHLSHTTLRHTHTHRISLSHTIFHIQLVLLLDHPSHPLSFLPSPSPLQNL